MLYKDNENKIAWTDVVPSGQGQLALFDEDRARAEAEGYRFCGTVPDSVRDEFMVTDKERA